MALFVISTVLLELDGVNVDFFLDDLVRIVFLKESPPFVSFCLLSALIVEFVSSRMFMSPTSLSNSYSNYFWCISYIGLNFSATFSIDLYGYATLRSKA